MTKFDSTAQRRLRVQAALTAMDAQATETENSLLIEALLRDLSAHEVEIEGHKLELRQAQQALGVSQERYAALYEMAPVGCCTVNAAD